eukprot:gene4613-14954_t
MVPVVSISFTVRTLEFELPALDNADSDDEERGIIDHAAAANEDAPLTQHKIKCLFSDRSQLFVNGKVVGRQYYINPQLSQQTFS